MSFETEDQIRKRFVPHTEIQSSWNFVKCGEKIIGLKQVTIKMFEQLDEKGNPVKTPAGDSLWSVDGNLLVKEFTQEEYNKILAAKNRE